MSAMMVHVPYRASDDLSNSQLNRASDDFSRQNLASKINISQIQIKSAIIQDYSKLFLDYLIDYLA